MIESDQKYHPQSEYQVDTWKSEYHGQPAVESGRSTHDVRTDQRKYPSKNKRSCEPPGRSNSTGHGRIEQDLVITGLTWRDEGNHSDDRAVFDQEVMPACSRDCEQSDGNDRDRDKWTQEKEEPWRIQNGRRVEDLFADEGAAKQRVQRVPVYVVLILNLAAECWPQHFLQVYPMRRPTQNNHTDEGQSDHRSSGPDQNAVLSSNCEIYQQRHWEELRDRACRHRSARNGGKSLGGQDSGKQKQREDNVKLSIGQVVTERVAPEKCDGHCGQKSNSRRLHREQDDSTQRDHVQDCPRPLRPNR